MTFPQVDAWMCQGYSLAGEPVGKPLHGKDAWSAAKVAVCRQWTVDSAELPAEPEQSGDNLRQYHSGNLFSLMQEDGIMQAYQDMRRTLAA